MNTIRVSTGTMIRAAVLVGLISLGFLLSDLIIALLVAVVLASAVEPIVTFGKKYKIPRPATVPITFILGFGFAAISVILFVPKIASDMATFVARLPELLDSISLFGIDFGLRDLSAYINETSKQISEGQIMTILKNFVLGAGSALHATGIVISNVFNTFLIIVLSFYLAMQEKGVSNFLKIITPRAYEEYVIGLWDRSQKKISDWARGQIVLGVIVGVMVYITLLVIGIEYAAFLAILAFAGELIPVVGLTLAMVPALLVALATGGPATAGVVFLAYFVIGQIENHVLYPNVMHKMVGVPSVMVIISLIIGAKMAGFWGILIAVPLAAIVMGFLDDLDNHKLPQVD